MKLISFRHGDRTSYGMQVAGGAVDLGTLDCPDLRSALLRGDDLTRLDPGVGSFVPDDEIILLPPIPTPDKTLCVGYNYRSHLVELGVAIPAFPSLFVRFPGAQVGHTQPIMRPFLSEQFDYEGELAVVIGRAGRHIPASRAMAHVAGYACFADNSVRDYQRQTTQATAGKNFEASGAFGPCLVTADEVADIGALTLVTRLNGQEVQRSGLDDLIFSVPDLIAYASAFTRLLPGDVIATGTPGGVGLTHTPPLWLRAGDELEVEIAGIGSLRNPVIDEQQEH